MEESKSEVEEKQPCSTAEKMKRQTNPQNTITG